MRRNQKKSFWRTIFFSYLILLAFTMVAGSFLLQSSLRKIEENTEQLSQISLSQTADAVRQTEKDIQSLINSLRAREEYTSLVFAETPITSFKQYKIAKLQSEMHRQVAYSHYISGIYIWFDFPQMAATTNGFAQTEESFDLILQNELGIRLQTTYAWADENNGTISLHALGNNGTAEKLIAVIRHGDGRYGSLELVEVNLSAFRTQLTSGQDTEGETFFWITFRENGLLSAPSDALAFAEAADLSSLSPGRMCRISFEDTDYAVMCLDTDENFILYSATEFSAYSETQRNYAAMVILFLLLYLAVGLLLSVFFSRRNSRPVEKLTDMLLNKTAVSSADGELAVLEAGINSLLKVSQDYAQVQVQEEKSRQEQALIALLRGEWAGKDFKKNCSLYGFRFSSGRFAVIAIAISSCGDLFTDEDSDKGKSARELAAFAVSSAAGELLGEYGCVYIGQYDGRLWALISPAPHHERLTDTELNSLLHQCCEHSEAFLREQLHIETKYSISAFIPSDQEPAASIHNAYREALWGLEQMESYAIQTAVNSRSEIREFLKPKSTNPPDNPEAERRRFYSAVVAGDFEEAEYLYLELRRPNMPFTEDSFAAVRMQTVILASFLLSHLPPESLDEHAREIESRLSSLHNEQHDNHLIEQMKNWMIYFHHLHQKSTEKNPEEKTDIALNASLYINIHYTDPDISLASLSENLLISSSYLSRIFRQKYGLSIFDYIHRRRVDLAKLLLRESDITVESIAQQVGYTNALSLIRAFRRMENCTPTEYRRSLQSLSASLTEQESDANT